MTLKVKIRQTIEFFVEVDDRDENEIRWFDEALAEGRVDTMYNGASDDFDVLLTEVVSREHETNYVLGVDTDAELFQLEGDGEVIFSHRDHNEVVREWGRRTGTEVRFTKDGHETHYSGGSVWMDYGDPDACWDLLKGRNK